MKCILACKIMTILLLLICIETILGQESEEKDKPTKRNNQSFVIRLSEQDLIIPVTSIEWGHPERWSFTSRYIHEFEKRKKRIPWRNNIVVSLIPGLSGGRLGVGYLGLYSPANLKDFGLFIEFRGILLRTWGNPLSTSPNTTFVGAELKTCLSWLLNIGIGYYLPISNPNENIKSFWGFHLGIGI